MKRGIVVTLLVAAALGLVAAAAAARDPRLEKLQLKPADMRLARSAVLRRSDLGAGWTPLRVGASDPEAPDCPGYRPDFSKFTVTGQADSQFSTRGGSTSVLSRVEVYASKAQARGDFALSTLPPVARCLGLMLQREAAKGSSGLAFELVSSRRVHRVPRLGERSVAYRIVSEASSGGASIRVYVDVLVVLRGRSIGAVFFTGALKPVAGRQRVASHIARRLR